MKNDQNIPHLEAHQEIPTLDPIIPLKVDSIIKQKYLLKYFDGKNKQDYSVIEISVIVFAYIISSL